MLTSHLYVASWLTTEDFTASRAGKVPPDIIWRAIKRAQTPAHKEPTGLITHGGKRPDGATLIP